MLISLSTRGFRNLADGEWRVAAGSNIVYGANGAGKSSLLEAVYLVSTTRSFRTGRLAECRRLEGDSFHVGAEAGGDERARLEVAHDGEGKRRRVNGKSGPVAEHLAVLPVASWTSRDNEVFQGPPAVRRRMVDRGLVSEQPASLGVISEYRQALEAKKAVLESQTGALEDWNRILADRGSTLAQRRAAWIDRLQETLSDILRSSPIDLGEVELRYRPSPPEAVSGAEEMLEAIERRAAGELARRMVLVGPHRDDLEFLWRHGAVGRMASAGERKLLGLALVVAQARLMKARGSEALLLVDDLDAELDERHVEQIWSLLAGEGQLIAATSRKRVVNSLPAEARWRLRDGILSRIGDDPEEAR